MKKSISLSATIQTIRLWMPLCWDADWRWGESDAASYWYPDVRLVRQSVAGDWKPVMAQLAADLKRFAS
jgi:hypothetical protein